MSDTREISEEVHAGLGVTSLIAQKWIDRADKSVTTIRDNMMAVELDPAHLEERFSDDPQMLGATSEELRAYLQFVLPALLETMTLLKAAKDTFAGLALLLQVIELEDAEGLLRSRGINPEDLAV